MTKKQKYLDSLFTELSERVGWDLISEKELLMNYIVEQDLTDNFLNFAEKIAVEEENM